MIHPGSFLQRRYHSHGVVGRCFAVLGSFDVVGTVIGVSLLENYQEVRRSGFQVHPETTRSPDLGPVFFLSRIRRFDSPHLGVHDTVLVIQVLEIEDRKQVYRDF